MKEKINNFITDALDKLKNAQLHLTTTKEQSIIINKSYFDKKFMHKEDVTDATEDFKTIKLIKDPVLYWFELSNTENNHAIRKEYEKYRKDTKIIDSLTAYRNTSSYKKKPNYESKFLYVGKVETSFWGRLVTHLGYSQSEKAAGMQLFHWYNPEVYGDIRLNYIVFDEKMKHLILMLEKQLATDLEPLIGRY